MDPINVGILIIDAISLIILCIQECRFATTETTEKQYTAYDTNARITPKQEP